MSYQKHLGISPDEKLNFKQYIDSAISKVNKGILVIKNKAFLRPLIMVILSKTSHKMNLFLWKKRICAVQPTLAITGATQGTSHDKIYQKLGLE